MVPTYVNLVGFGHNGADGDAMHISICMHAYVVSFDRILLFHVAPQRHRVDQGGLSHAPRVVGHGALEGFLSHVTRKPNT